jgi:hypothetical protein
LPVPFAADPQVDAGRHHPLHDQLSWTMRSGARGSDHVFLPKHDRNPATL